MTYKKQMTSNTTTLIDTTSIPCQVFQNAANVLEHAQRVQSFHVNHGGNYWEGLMP